MRKHTLHFETVGKPLFKLGEVWTHHDLAVPLVAIASNILLVIRLRLIPWPSGGDLRDDRSIVSLLVSEGVDQGLGCAEL